MNTKNDSPLEMANVALSGLHFAVESFGMTDRGKVRPQNEDQFLIAALQKTLMVHETSLSHGKFLLGDNVGYLFVVADGMGGHAAGEKASSLAVQSIERFVLKMLSWCYQVEFHSQEELSRELKQALEHADARILREARDRPSLEGMATTLTLGYLSSTAMYIAHAGDSRAYLLRDGILQRITKDHTVAAEMGSRGIISTEEAEKSPFRHCVTNALGGEGLGVRPELHKVAVLSKDVFLFCSDGLTNMVSDKAIYETLNGRSSCQDACRKLIQLALEKGGKDNITAIVAGFTAA
jgi:protein phosphatase